MNNESWRSKLRDNARKTADLWVDEGEHLAYTESRGQAGARLLTMVMAAAAVGVASHFGVSELAEAGNWSFFSKTMMQFAGMHVSLLAGFAADQWLGSKLEKGQRADAPPTLDDMLENENNRQQASSAVKELFRQMEDDPSAREEVVRLLSTDQGREVFFNTIETQSLDTTADRFREMIQAGVGPDDEVEPESGPGIG